MNQVLAEMDRCPWAKTDLYVQYHDSEWGVPLANLFGGVVNFLLLIDPIRTPICKPWAS